MVALAGDPGAAMWCPVLRAMQIKGLHAHCVQQAAVKIVLTDGWRVTCHILELMTGTVTSLTRPQLPNLHKSPAPGSLGA